MNIAVLLLVSIAAVTVAYFTYGRLLSRWLGIDPSRKTPAHTMQDGVDYVPARAPVLLGHHFASIAGAGPIVGPIVAGLAFGWLPVWLWILVGAVFIGAVHDFASLVASVRHGGRSIGEVIEKYLGLTGKRLFLIFAWCTLLLVIAVFMDVVAGTFESKPEAATASLLFVALAVVFGLLLQRGKVPLWAASIAGVAILFLCIYVGYRAPVKIVGEATRDARCLVLVPMAAAENAAAEEVTAVRKDATDKNLMVWKLVLLAYIFVASVTPVWILLQPRDYLNSFILYALMIGAVAGILLAPPSIRMPETKAFVSEAQGPLFPMLFVLVACGAISGFHSLVASGTTAKQLRCETDARPIGYGGMLIEGVLAVVALGAIAAMTPETVKTLLGQGKKPGALFAIGVGEFIHAGFAFIPAAVATTFAALAVSAFAMTSLDTGTRLGRFAFQELAAPGGDERKRTFLTNRFVATAVTTGGGAALVFSGSAWTIWPVFGAANQLLAALALLSIAVWLAARGRPSLFVKIPMVFMFAVTLSALVVNTIRRAREGKFVLVAIQALLFVFAIVLVTLAWKSLWKPKPPPAASPEAA